MATEPIDTELRKALERVAAAAAWDVHAAFGVGPFLKSALDHLAAVRAALWVVADAAMGQLGGKSQALVQALYDLAAVRAAAAEPVRGTCKSCGHLYVQDDLPYCPECDARVGPVAEPAPGGLIHAGYCSVYNPNAGPDGGGGTCDCALADEPEELAICDCGATFPEPHNEPCPFKWPGEKPADEPAPAGPTDKLREALRFCRFYAESCAEGKDIYWPYVVELIDASLEADDEK